MQKKSKKDEKRMLKRSQKDEKKKQKESNKDEKRGKQGIRFDRRLNSYSHCLLYSFSFDYADIFQSAKE